MQHHLGLSTQQASDLLRKFGANEIVGKPRVTAVQILVSQFTSLLVILLILAAIGSLFLGDLLDGIFIILIVVLNGVLGFVQEYRAEKAIEALKKLTVSSVRTLRDGVEQKIDNKMLVPGDIILLEEGDKIPADCELVEAMHLETNEASLTGESLPVEKNVRDAEKKLLFLGTIIAKGRGKAVVVSTGMSTRFGQIAKSLSEITDEETPLQKKLTTLGKQLGIMALIASSVVFVIGYLSQYPLIEMILTSVSLAVAAVPEGLPAVVTITLAVGMQRMAKKKAILRKLASIEALGATTVIATDKTGTLTKNEMHVTKVWIEDKEYAAHDSTLPLEHSTFNTLLNAGVLNNNASLVLKKGQEKYDVLGDTTEGALLLLASDKAITREKLKENATQLEEFAFDPVLKLMSVVWSEHDQKTIYCKGAPEMVLERSDNLQMGDTSIVITPEKRIQIEDAFQMFAKEGLRVIALAYRHTKEQPRSRHEAEKNLTFLGFVGISDPPRQEVKEAIIVAESAGIRTIMITGDNELTASAIGTKIGLLKEGEEIITGAQLAELSDDEALARLPHIRIFARTTPDQKLRIVRLLQKLGHIVAVTGDGVNDALALKQSDVGVAMGTTGTDVAKEASDMIIVDDNYATLVVAIGEGRTIFDNIKSAVKYLVGCNVGEVVAVVAGMFIGWPLILTPLQLLYINLATDGLPAIALAVTPKRDGIMKKRPRTSRNMFNRRDLGWFGEVSSLTAITTLIAFAVGNMIGSVNLARSFAFTTIILVQHFILLDVWLRNGSILRSRVFRDKMFLLAFFGPIFVQPLILYTPFLQKIFKVEGMSFLHLIIVVAISGTVLITSEIRKSLFTRRYR